MRERMAVIFAQGAFGRCADMAKDKPGGGFRGDSLQVGAVPSGDSRREQARCGTQLGVSIESYSKAICVVLASSCVLQKGIESRSARWGF